MSKLNQYAGLAMFTLASADLVATFLTGHHIPELWGVVNDNKMYLGDAIMIGYGTYYYCNSRINELEERVEKLNKLK